jgi:iron complex outermembrane receptor protein
LFVINRDYTRGAWGGAEALVTKTLLSRHKLTAGSEFRRNFRQDQGNYDEDPFYQHLADKRSSDLWALYVQDEFTIRKQLIFNAGVRYDRYDTFGGTINPRLGLIYSPLKKTTFKFLFGEAFRAPNAYELFYQGGGLKFNPKLEPETIKTSEVILEQYFGDRARLTASGFYYRINNLISQQTDPADGLIQYRNAEKAEAKGFEFGLQGRLRFGLEGRLSYTAQEAKNQRTGDALANSPRHLAKFDLMLPLIKKKLFAGLEGQFMSKRRNVTGEEVDGFFVSNLTLFSQRLVKGLEISFSAYNVFNKRYGDPGAEEHRQRFIEQDGRSFRLKLTYRFNLWE